MFTSHAKKLANHQIASAAEEDQLQAELREAEEQLLQSEHNRRQRAVQEARQRLRAAQRRHQNELHELTAQVADTNPAGPLLEQLAEQARSRIATLQQDYGFAKESPMFDRETTLEYRRQLVEHCQKRDAQIHGWFDIQRGLVNIWSSVTPFTDLRDLLDRHAGTLPELSYISFEIPESELGLADVSA